MSTASPESTRVDKVRKLIALSGSANTHEAALAAEKAHALMLRHGIDIAQLANSASNSAIGQARTEGRLDPWRRKLAASIAHSMGGAVTFTRSDHRANAGMMSFFAPAGTAHSIAALYQHLEAQLASIATLATADRAHTRVDSRTYRTSFLLGAVDGLHWRLARNQAENTTNTDGPGFAATMYTWDAATEEPAAPHGTERHANALSLHWNAYRRGERAGAAVELAAKRPSDRQHELPARPQRTGAERQHAMTHD